MTILKRKIILAVISGLFLSTTAVSAGSLRITALGGVSAPMMFLDPLPAKTLIVPDFGLAIGGLVTADFLPILKFDAGLLYKKTGFSMSTTSLPVIETKMSYEQLFVPVTARLELLFFSIGAGFYYAMPLKDEVTVSTNLPVKSSSTATFANSNLSGSNFGVMGTLGLRFKLPLIPIGLMADVWYLHGLSELSTTTASIKQGDLQILLGVSLYL